MKYKGDHCYSCTRKEAIAALKDGARLRVWKFGPMIHHGDKELHPQKRTYKSLIHEGIVVDVTDEEAEKVQIDCGLAVYKYKEPSDG